MKKIGSIALSLVLCLPLGLNSFAYIQELPDADSTVSMDARSAMFSIDMTENAVQEAQNSNMPIPAWVGTDGVEHFTNISTGAIQTAAFSYARYNNAISSIDSQKNGAIQMTLEYSQKNIAGLLSQFCQDANG